MAVKAVLFDFDGTLIDTSELIFRSFEYALDTVLGKQIPREELLWTFGRPLALIMETLGGEHAEELLQAFRHYSIAHETEITLFPDVRETLEYLKAHGVKTAIVTSRVRESAMRDLEILQLDPALFDAILTPESTTMHKPHPEPAQKALELLGTAPEEAIMIGDSMHDIHCGKDAGCKTAYVAYSFLPHGELQACLPDYCFTSLKDCIELLEVDDAHESLHATQFCTNI